MYTVKQVSRLTGLPPATLRAWEGRYRVVVPHRSDAGYRLYDEHQLATLRRMATLVQQGAPPSRAAAVVQAWQGDRTDVVAATPPRGHDLVAAGRRMDPAALASLLERALPEDGVEEAIEHWLMPELVRIGDAWSCGALTAAQEHVVSRAVVVRLGQLGLRVPEPPAGQAPTVLLGLAPQSQHDLGLRCFGLMLRRRGLRVVDLGADVPLVAWRASVDQLLPRAVVLAVVLPEDAARADEVAATLAVDVPGGQVLVGGPLAHRCRVARQLPWSLAEAADALRQQLLAGVAA